MPAHITVLFPFVPADDLDDDVRGLLTAALGPIEPFDCRLTSTAWFGDDVL